jgi:hypothetical protein
MHLLLIHSSNATHKREGRQKQANLTLQPSLRWAESHFPLVVIEEGNNSMVLRKEKDWWIEMCIDRGE